MYIKEKSRRKSLIFLIAVILVLLTAFFVISTKSEKLEISQQTSTEDTIKDLNEESVATNIEKNENEKDKDNDKEIINANTINETRIVKLDEKNCVYEAKKKSATIKKYAGTEDCVIIPSEIEGKKVEKIAKDAFKECYNLETIKIPIELEDAITEIKYFEVNEENTDDEYIELKTTREYAEDYIVYMSQSEEEREKSEIVPEKFNVPLEEIYSAEMEQLYNVSSLAKEGLEEKFDLRDYIEIEAEHQGSLGTCYTYAALTAAETNIALKRGELVDFSEIHAAMLSSGCGGNFSDVNDYYNDSYGPVYELDWSSKNLGNSTTIIESYLRGENKYDYNSEVKPIQTEMTLKSDEIEDQMESVYFPSITDSDKKDSSKREEVENTRLAIKEHIKKYGSLYASIYYSLWNSYQWNGYAVMNYQGQSITNHAVSIIGWDDNFSKENFPEEIRPEEDGAYLVLNSYGETYGDNGTFWISYEDKWIETDVSGIISTTTAKNNMEIKDFIIKDADTNEIIKDGKLKNIIKKGRKITVSFDLINVADNAKVDIEKLNVVLRNPIQDINMSINTYLENGYITMQIDTNELKADSHYIIEIDNGEDKISKSIKIISGRLFNYVRNGDGGMTITGYKGTDKDVVIPEIYEGLEVLQLDNYSFYYNAKVETITMHDKIKTIQSRAIANGVIIIGKKGSTAEEFANEYGYTFLEEGTQEIVGDYWKFNVENKTLTINGDMPKYDEGSAPWYKFYRRIYNVIVEDNVKEITDYAFYNCTNLKEITIGRKIENISNTAFEGCNLTICGYENTQAEIFAEENNIPFTKITDFEMNLISYPNKLKYIIGEELDLTGGKILVTYKDGTTEEILMTDEKVKVTGYDKEVSGEQEIVVTYEGKNIIFKITVVGNGVSEIQIQEMPNKTIYVKGQQLDLTGGKILVTYEDGTTEEILMTDEKVKVTGYDKEVSGEQEIVVTYEGKNIIFKITVVGNEVSEIQIQEMPNKTIYVKGQQLDLTGGKILVTYKDGTTEEILMTDEKVKVLGYDPNTLGEQKITIEYSGYKTTLTIVVKDSETTNPGENTGENPTGEKVLVDIEITKKPKKQKYTEGEEFDTSGMVITAKYSDGTEETIKNYTYAPYGALKTKDDNITIIYTDGDIIKTVDYSITVKEKKSEDKELDNDINNELNNNNNINDSDNKIDNELTDSTQDKDEEDSLESSIKNNMGIKLIILIFCIFGIYIIKRK